MFRYLRTIKKWVIIPIGTAAVVAPASRGCLYVVSGTASDVNLYRDTMSDTSVSASDTTSNPLLLLQKETEFSNWLFNDLSLPSTTAIRDMLFIPVNDSTGHLFVATSAGSSLTGTQCPEGRHPFSR